MSGRQNIVDPDRRVAENIGNLKDDEIGYHKVKSLRQNGSKLDYSVEGTILEVMLDEPILPGGTSVFEMEFESQVPMQIRRSGRNNAEGIAYSMSQWYPKLSEYDEDGWHPNPYVGREFYGVWGDFDVKITIASDYTVAAGGYLQNAEQIGHGYTEQDVNHSEEKLTWHFKAPNVHDFMWAADPDYTHTMHKTNAGPVLHFFYQETEDNKGAWEKLPMIMDKALDYMNGRFRRISLRPMYAFVSRAATEGWNIQWPHFITGNRSLNSLVGVSIHEWMHSWYQMVLGTNESLYAWMDEGFTSYASARVMNELARQGLLPGREYVESGLYERTYNSFGNFAQSGVEELLSTHADHFVTNSAYGVGAYVKGNIFLNQLEYIIGKDAFDKTLLRYYNEWKFKHPDVDDFIRVAEKCSGMVLDWYKEYWVYQTHTIDYEIADIGEEKKSTLVTLRRRGTMPMPVEMTVTLSNGDQTTYYAPLRIMRGAKQAPEGSDWVQLDDWPWTNPTYTIEVPEKLKKIEKIELDVNRHVMDVNRENDVQQLSQTGS